MWCEMCGAWRQACMQVCGGGMALTNIMAIVLCVLLPRRKKEKIVIITSYVPWTLCMLILCEKRRLLKAMSKSYLVSCKLIIRKLIRSNWRWAQTIQKRKERSLWFFAFPTCMRINLIRHGYQFSIISVSSSIRNPSSFVLSKQHQARQNQRKEEQYNTQCIIYLMEWNAVQCGKNKRRQGWRIIFYGFHYSPPVRHSSQSWAVPSNNIVSEKRKLFRFSNHSFIFTIASVNTVKRNECVGLCLHWT